MYAAIYGQNRNFSPHNTTKFYMIRKEDFVHKTPVKIFLLYDCLAKTYESSKSAKYYVSTDFPTDVGHDFNYRTIVTSDGKYIIIIPI